ncbi:hypothetical protein U1769_15170 [Sphingomonas sp. ZT3P38]|uniref:hypothetical protein n=1 Tax=Parasphingomonas zepuensis TaxID=3096161 RepID=UPI002FC7177B
MPAPAAINELVSHFHDNKDLFRGANYNEARTRREFIDPMLESLGWDVQNKLYLPEGYKHVIHEDSIKIEGSVKAPDYAFHAAGEKRFFLEAKKPSVNIRDDAHPAFQLRRYAWSAKLPLSILTDFEEFAIYDCRYQPRKEDKASVARLEYFTYEDYEQRWDEIEGLFSRDAVMAGSLDRFAEKTKRKRGTTEVDDAFLSEIEHWREDLARNIALRNTALSVRQLNTAVQKIIDRIIFLRIAEDRGIESYGTLRKIDGKKDAYAQLCSLFVRADARYNSGLFHFKESKDVAEAVDTLTTKLTIDGEIISWRFGDTILNYPPLCTATDGDAGHGLEAGTSRLRRRQRSRRASALDAPSVTMC